MVIKKYLNHYADASLAFKPALQGSYSCCLVIPICQESDNIVSLLKSIEQAAIFSQKKILLILIVNQRQDAPAYVKEDNQKTISWLQGREDAFQNLHLITLDFATQSSRCFGPDDGVGLARKIACDHALAYFAEGHISEPWIFCSDADVEFPKDYFILPATCKVQHYSVALKPFVHQATSALSQHEVDALKQYERYFYSYVDGLRYAGSPYAYHSLGSIMVISCVAYAVVRGFPKRQAGEDFYLLNKAAKYLPILELQSSPLIIAGRLSQRVPFGTGPSIQKISQNQASFPVYDPKLFIILKAFLNSVESYLADQKFDDDLKYLHERYSSIIETSKTLSSQPQIRSKHFHCAFDALKTLQFIHDRGKEGPRETTQLVPLK